MPYRFRAMAPTRHTLARRPVADWPSVTQFVSFLHPGACRATLHFRQGTVIIEAMLGGQRVAASIAVGEQEGSTEWIRDPRRARPAHEPLGQPVAFVFERPYDRVEQRPEAPGILKALAVLVCGRSVL